MGNCCIQFVCFGYRLYRKYSGWFFLDIANEGQLPNGFFFPWSYCSALIKQVNKSIDGTADDEDEGVPTDQAIRAGLELLKVNIFKVKLSG